MMNQEVVTNSYHFYQGDVIDVYSSWPEPNAIISDGAYGIRGFEGDTTGTGELAEWYRPHLRQWDRFAMPSSTLWFWNTEIGWANVHALIEKHGWKYIQTIVWDKGISHIAGNVNGKTIRQYPVVSEICVLYQRNISFKTEDGPLEAKDWLRREWLRSGLPFSKANVACGVKNAATRKYLTKEWVLATW
jgi:site-specific DNA-methyltransferase (adenine-specific)